MQTCKFTRLEAFHDAVIGFNRETSVFEHADFEFASAFERLAGGGLVPTWPMLKKCLKIAPSIIWCTKNPSGANIADGDLDHALKMVLNCLED